VALSIILKAMTNRILFTLYISLIGLTALASSPLPYRSTNTAYPLFRLKLVLDSFDYDDIAIGFNSSATTTYNNNIDSRYLPGINSPEGLSSLSSDDVQLSVNIVPLPKQGPLLIRLDVEAAKSGTFTLQRTELDTIPLIYDIWLMDKYTKDSLNLRTSTNYRFNINKNDSTSFGGNRFVVIIRENPALGFHLLNFGATKTTNGANTTWATENEQNSTGFIVERSIDDGKTFYPLDSLASTGAGTYSFTDKNPINGTDAYRLKITDVNNSVSYSNVATLTFDNTTPVETASNNSISIYPNPSNGVINLAINTGNNSAAGAQTPQANSLTHSFATLPASTNDSYDIKIVNITGTVIKTALSSSANWQANVSSLSPGTYIIQVINNNDKKVVGKSTFVKL
jgi:trimeric autotransporter adhesin